LHAYCQKLHTYKKKYKIVFFLLYFSASIVNQFPKGLRIGEPGPQKNPDRYTFMKPTPKTLLKKIQERLWLWRPILLFIFIGFFIFSIGFNHCKTTDLMNELRANYPITKVEMNVISDAGENNFVLTDRAQLDSIDRAFKAAKEKDIQVGGGHDTRAEVNVYKGRNKINLFIQHSVYHGWMVEVGNKTLTSEYLFVLVARYARKR
jgi:hypothetical protein